MRAHWANRLGFILAATGSAVGLGNIWKFPYITGINGGGAFVLIYLVCIAAVGIPIFIAELYIGQKSQSNAVQAFGILKPESRGWGMVGVMGVLSAFLILSFYSVVGGWVLDFTWRNLTMEFADMGDESIKAHLGGLFGNPTKQMFWHTLFMGGTIAIVLGGIQAGIERWSKILMPTLFVLLGFLLIQSFFLPGFPQAVSFLFSPDTSKLTRAGVLEAVGHAFFTLSLGMGAMITYGSYLDRKWNLTTTAFVVAFMDTLIAILAGLVIFSIVYTHGLEPGAGPTLMFQTLPVLFSKMAGGTALGIAFFLLVSFAAFTSAISLLEVVVTYFVERFRMTRLNATLLSGLLIYGLGILSALSTNELADFKPLMGHTFFDGFDQLTSKILLPVGGLLISLYYGWGLGKDAVEATVGKGPQALGLLWSARVLAPVAIALMLANGLGLLG